MKKILCVILCVAMLCLCGCAGGKAEEKPVGENTLLKDDGKTLKMLTITSSFGVNTTEYIYDIATAHGATNVVVGRLYFGGCTLRRHVNNAQTDNPEYTYYKNTSGEWVTTEEVSMIEGILDEDWDLFFIQQSAAQSPLADTYGTYVDQLIEYINEKKTNADAKIIWNMTWAYQSDSKQDVFVNDFKADQMLMYNALVKVTNDLIVPRQDIAAIVPTGTAIQNARTSYFKDNLTADTYHLNDLGKVIAGYELYRILLDKPLTEICLTEVTELFSLSDSNKQVILEVVNAAAEKPYEVTNSSYTER